jgi:hypothetical protein
MSPPLVVSQAEASTAVRIFAEAVDHVATHHAADREAVAADKRAGLVSEGFGASG